MKRKKRSVSALLFSLLLLISLAMPANATSDYDDVFAVASLARVSDTYTDSYNNHTCIPQDIATSWSSYLMDDSKWSHAVYASGVEREILQTAWATALENGTGWALIELEVTASNVNTGNFFGATGDHQVKLVFTPDADNQTIFMTYGGVRFAFMKGTGSAPVYSVVMSQYWNASTQSCNVEVVVARIVASSAASWTLADSGVQVGDDAHFPFVHRQLLVNSPVTTPFGYEGVVVPSQYTPPSPTYVAIGDSFSSGEGNSPFEAGTDEDDVNECHRSTRAYPRLLENSLLGLGSTVFVACSGATTASVLYGGSGEGSWSAPPQVNALSGATQKVTITVGGNDVGFASYVLGCVVVCGPGTPVYAAMMAGINEDFEENLKTTYQTILSKAPNAEVYVLDYPYMSSDDVPGCGPFDLSGARSVQQLLNATISNAVSEVNNPRLHFVPTNYAGSPFEGRNLCTNDPRRSMFSLVTMHPNAEGQRAYWNIVTASLN